MKLYATVKSERASKGQGGKCLDIEVKNEKQETILTLTVVPEGEDEDGEVFHAKISTHESVFLGKIGDIPKGNKQKGEPIPFNSKQYKKLRKADEGNW